MSYNNLTKVSVSVVTEELMEAQNTFSLKDALKNVSGLTIAAAEGGHTGDSINLRRDVY